MKVLAVIPSRIGSTRLPEKPLAMLAGKPLLQHVWEGARSSARIDRLVIATDSARIEAAATAFGAEVALTNPLHPTGSDRVWEVASRHEDCDVVLNLQGDEPMIDASVIEALLRPFQREPGCVMTTLRRRIDPSDAETIANPNVVKVVCDRRGRALYFSRHSIPFDRDGVGVERHRHVGLYGFKRSFLDSFRKLERGDLEKTESLEQLRVLEHGYRIFVGDCPVETVDVNAPEDLPRAEALLRARRL